VAAPALIRPAQRAVDLDDIRVTREILQHVEFHLRHLRRVSVLRERALHGEFLAGGGVTGGVHVREATLGNQAGEQQPASPDLDEDRLVAAG
jgi:hypothetical protein